MDTLVKWIVIVFLRGLSLLPYTARIWLVSSILRLFAFFVPTLKKVSLKNLELVFPDSEVEWRNKIVNQSFDSLAQAIVDFERLPRLDLDWVKKHVEIPFWQRFLELKRENSKCGIIIASGHLGSFELQGFVSSLLGHPISFIVRNFKLPALDHWWNSIRGLHGNHVIARTGAVKEMLFQLRKGRDVAILFDQNVQRKHAVFVDWFGHSAATTKALGFVALKTEAVVLVSSISSLEHGNYRINISECNFSTLYNDASLTDDQKVLLITQKVVAEYEKLIKQDPHAWFWMHRRWRTRPNPDEPEFY